MPVYAAPSIDPDNPTAHDPRESEEALDSCKTLASQPASTRRQIGLARVHIEILSLHKDVRTRKPNGEITDSSDPETEDDEMNEEGGAGTGGKDNAAELNQAVGSSANTPLSPRNNHPNSSGRNHESEDQGRDNDNSKPPPRPTAIPKETQKLRRFACPYQAFEANQSCFRQGPRNPEGGCASVSRLKQHLNRRHMLSYRCQHCWRSFESKLKLASHGKQREPCEAREMPSTERFMSAEHETELERLTCSGSDEETWWSLFQRLIPGMQERELSSLKAEFFPYYICFDSFMIPAITFSNASFQPLATGQPGLQDITSNGYESLDQISSDSPSVVDPMLFSIPSTPSYSLSVPLLEAPIGSQQQPNSQPRLIYTPSQSAVASTDSLSNMPRTNRAIGRTQQQASDQTQLRRNYQRLKVRNTRAEAENGELRENNRCARADIGRMDSVLDDLLAAEDLPSHLFDKLSEVSEILLSIKSRIR
ncbi:hypothetical protein B0J13DRAFT_550625 [Dactylonectria estremocensis]|uniref:C2H2-type domain-containing protein n=1 Tax=Dactylonectria estremocensis TaxID=1079267 RepID=A0A9P9EZP2_9HYPO|nr:hypothetical protein B0J13DRAFT_550625 [Dactylonectria estremocensis]